MSNEGPSRRKRDGRTQPALPRDEQSFPESMSRLAQLEAEAEALNSLLEESDSVDSSHDDNAVALTVGVYEPPRSLPETREAALAIIAQNEAVFRRRLNLDTGTYYLLARSSPDGPVGPRLTGAIYAALVTGGLKVQRWRTHPFQAEDGDRYHAFFLVSQPDGSPPSHVEVRDALGRGIAQVEDSELTVPTVQTVTDSAAPATPESAPEGRADRQQSADLLAELEAVAARATYWEKRAVSLQHTEDRRVAALLERSREMRNALLRALSEAGQRTDDGTGTRLSQSLSRIHILEKDVDALISEIESTDRELDSARADLAAAESARKSDRTRIAHLEHALHEARKERDSLRHNTSRPRTAVLDIVLPDVAFLQHTDELLMSEFTQPDWLRALSAMAFNFSAFKRTVEERGGKVDPIDGIPGAKKHWFEVRLSASRGDMQRAYVTSSPAISKPAGKEWLVLLHWKKDDKEQRNVLKRLPRK